MSDKVLRFKLSLFAEDCQYTCPELHACVNASIWCDGKVHCPSGYDESFIHCSRILRLPAEALAVLCVLFIVGCCACSLYIRRFVIVQSEIEQVLIEFQIYSIVVGKSKITASAARSSRRAWNRWAPSTPTPRNGRRCSTKKTSSADKTILCDMWRLIASRRSKLKPRIHMSISHRKSFDGNF